MSDPTNAKRVLALVITSTAVQAFDMIPRWGHAAVYTSDLPAVLIHGGKTSQESGQTYSSSPNSPDLIRLPLSSAFDVGSPPYELIDTPAPASVWHSLSALDKGGKQVLLFGGDGGADTPLPAGTDSAWIFNSTAFDQQPSGWDQQPARMIHHSAAASHDGKVYITGGQRNDGSGRILSDAYLFDGSTISLLPYLPAGTSDHISTLLPNGTLIVLGGVQVDVATGNPALAPFTTLYALDEGGPEWRTVNMGGEAPAPRRGASGFGDRTDRLIIMGGADVGREQAYGDVWRLDLSNPAWSRVDEAEGGPSPRFDFTATPTGDGKVVIFGGYGSDGPASADLFIYDIATNSWSNNFEPMQTPGSTDASSSSTSSAATTGVDGSTTPVAPPGSTANTGGGVSRPGGGSSDTDPTGSPSPDPTLFAGDTQHLSTGAQIGMAVGIVSGVSLLALLALLCLRRRRRRHVHQSRMMNEKGLDGEQTGLVPDWSEKGGIVGLGLGAVSAGWARISPQRRNITPYSQLKDEGMYTSPPARKSTRRIGNGIRLTGPPPVPSTSGGILRNGVMSPPRRDMLHDEDSRHFRHDHKQGDEEDWKVDAKSKGIWAPAGGILQSTSSSSTSDSEFDSDEESLLPAPRIVGGPVPTPMASASVIDPFDDSQSVDIGTIRSTRSIESTRSQRYQDGPGLDQLPMPSTGPVNFSDLVAVPDRYSYANNSLPRSMSSRGSTYFASSDAEEGVVQHAQRNTAQYASAHLVSPDPNEGQPVKRSESFFKRMTAGGIAGLLGGGGSQTSHEGYSRGARVGPSAREVDIRDWDRGIDRPGLWPVESRDEAASAWHHSRDTTDQSRLSESTDEAHGRGLAPPSAWNGVANRVHPAEQSLSSLTSARTMRDMVLVQREGTDDSQYPTSGHTGEGSSGSEASTSTGARPVLNKRNATPSSVAATEAEVGLIPANHGKEESEDIISFTNPSTPDIPPLPATPPTQPFEQVKLHKPADMPQPAAYGQPMISVTSHFSPLQSSTTSTEASASNGTSTPKKATRPPSPPNGSPLAKAIISHRRPVKDMVFSINKRSSTHFASDAGPFGDASSQASPTSTRSGSSARTGSSKASRADAGGNGRATEAQALFSPASQYSASPSGSPALGAGIQAETAGAKTAKVGGSAAHSSRRGVSWEVRRRESLVVANPDRK